ncbi:MAG TPA: hypothetical protein VGJ28_13295, partial [Micromonosporaceae bacterium]
MKLNANLLLTVGLAAAVMIRGGLWFVSFGELLPAFGADQVAWMVLPDLLFTLLLPGAAVALMIFEPRIGPRRAAIGAHVLGWIYLADNLIYATNIAIFYATSPEVVGARWVFGGSLAGLQLPLAMLCVQIIRRTA